MLHFVTFCSTPRRSQTHCLNCYHSSFPHAVREACLDKIFLVRKPRMNIHQLTYSMPLSQLEGEPQQRKKPIVPRRSLGYQSSTISKKGDDMKAKFRFGDSWYPVSWMRVCEPQKKKKSFKSDGVNSKTRKSNNVAGYQFASLEVLTQTAVQCAGQALTDSL